MHDRKMITEAIENCIGQPKCRDCPWEECEYEHEVVNSVPYSLLCEVLDILKGQDVVVPLTIDEAVSEILDKHYKRLKEQEAVVRCKDCIFGEQINDRYICTNAGHCQSKSNEPD